MMLNSEAYRVEPDNLIYGASHENDVRNVKITVPEASAGTIKRGQVVDFAAGKYSVHVAEGEASAIIAEDVEYALDETEVTATVYISGTFRLSACISDAELTVTDLEHLRAKGIFLK